jgi:hypothetical protein
MRSLSTRHGLTLAAVAAASTLLLASCSSGSDASSSSASSSGTPSDSFSLAASPSASSSVSASATTAPTGSAAAACATYFDIDLLNSQYAGGAVKQGDLTEQQVKDQFTTQLKDLSKEAKAAVADGSADAKMAKNAKKMKKLVAGLGGKQPVSSLTPAQQKKFATASLRVQKACERAGFPLPADNATARTAAGIQ